MAITNEDLLSILRDENQRASGFSGRDENTDLSKERARSLNFYKGDMSDEIPSLENRSSATSSEVSDAIEQVLPQLVEVFLEEDVCAFVPSSEADFAAAEQETDYVNHVIFQENDGFELMTNAIDDALKIKKGVWMWDWEEAEQAEDEVHEDLDQDSYENLMATVQPEQIVSDELVMDEVDGVVEITHNVTVRAPEVDGKVKIAAWAPDDVCVSEDTRVLGDGTYCAFRSRSRRQQLIADGFDAAKVRAIPAYNGDDNEVEDARNTTDEERILASAHTDFETVEVCVNFLRVLDGKSVKLMKVVTGGSDMEVVLEKEEVDFVPAAAIGVFPSGHRFYGQSLADKLVEIQKINTALLRMTLDSGYFAFNQRMIVDENLISKHTMADLLNNSPGAPIRAQSSTAVAPVMSSGMNFPALEMMEHMKTLAEGRSGVSRASMGLSPDTLHDTKGGMLALMNASQTRIRFMARIIAEGGFKDLALGVHRTLRKHSTVLKTARLRGKWTQVNPTSWALRERMTIQIGNAGGREHDVMMLQQILEIQKEALQAQGGTDGPFTTPGYMLHTAHRLVSRMGVRNPEAYFPDPSSYQPQQQQEEQGPDPAMLEMQAKMQLEQMKAQNDLQIAQMKASGELELKKQQGQQQLMQDQARMEQELLLAREKMQLEHQASMEKINLEAAARREQIANELQLGIATQQTEVAMEQYKMENGLGDAPDLREPRPGGDASV